MARLLCATFCSLTFSAATENSRACTGYACIQDPRSDELVRAAAAEEEEVPGLEMLQISNTKKTRKGGELEGKQEHDVAKQMDATLSAETQEKSSMSALLSNPETDILNEKDSERVRFLAIHPEWRDVIDVWHDGFFQRYYSGDAGHWYIEGDKLFLKWIGWNGEQMVTEDGGRTFQSPTKANFVLKNPDPTTWWLARFPINFRDDKERKSAMIQQKLRRMAMNSSLAERKAANLSLAEGKAIVDTKKTHDTVSQTPAIVETRTPGQTATLDEPGYQSVAALKDNKEMEAYMRRAVGMLGHRISDDKLFRSVVPAFSGVKSVKTFEALLTEFDSQVFDPMVGEHYLADISE